MAQAVPMGRTGRAALTGRTVPMVRHRAGYSCRSLDRIYVTGSSGHSLGEGNSAGE